MTKSYKVIVKPVDLGWSTVTGTGRSRTPKPRQGRDGGQYTPPTGGDHLPSPCITMSDETWVQVVRARKQDVGSSLSYTTVSFSSHFLLK